MRYEIDEEGITMRWGILFRREVSLTFARIQDIHLTSNFVERWLGLGRIQVQTASGSAKAEMTVEGVRDYEALRNFLYERMRGAGDADRTGERSALPGLTPEAVGQLTEALTATTDELRAIRRWVESRTPNGR
ncbi:MAG: PH domain-containing protein [Gemmatimonadota bacterium]